MGPAPHSARQCDLISQTRSSPREAKRVLADPAEGELVPFDVARYISNPVKVARIKAEPSQEDLASRMGQAYVSKLEKARKVSPKVLHQVSLALAKPKRPR